MGSPLVIRADASAAAGSGHVMRCLALAQAWRDRGGAVTFRCAELPGALHDRLRREEITVVGAREPAGSEEDAVGTAALAAGTGAAWVVVDGYGFDAAFERRLGGRGPRVLRIDDHGRAGDYRADLVLDQNLAAEAASYARRAPSTRLLLGSRYVLLRREFRRAGDPMPPPAGPVRRLLVTLGGGDQDVVVRLVLEALARLGPRRPETRIVRGHGGAPPAELRAAAERLPGTGLLGPVEDLADLMRRADLVLSGAGGTCWEWAALGRPGLVLTLSDNQRPNAEALAARGAAVDLGFAGAATAEVIAERLDALLQDPGARAELGERVRGLIDGHGAERVVKHLRGETLLVRPAGPGDRRLLWEWANDPEARARSFHPETIAWETHVEWFERRLADPDCVLLVGEDAADRPVGQVRFDLDAAGGAVVSVSVAPGERGRGLGTALLRQGIERLQAAGSGRLLSAFIRPDHLASRKLFERVGFELARRTEVAGHPALAYELATARQAVRQDA